MASKVEVQSLSPFLKVSIDTLKISGYDQFLLFGDSITELGSCQCFAKDGFGFVSALQEGNIWHFVNLCLAPPTQVTSWYLVYIRRLDIVNRGLRWRAYHFCIVPGIISDLAGTTRTMRWQLCPKLSQVRIMQEFGSWCATQCIINFFSIWLLPRQYSLERTTPVSQTRRQSSTYQLTSIDLTYVRFCSLQRLKRTILA